MENLERLVRLKNLIGYPFVKLRCPSEGIRTNNIVNIFELMEMIEVINETEE